jgi:hypothetical protein
MRCLSKNTRFAARRLAPDILHSDYAIWFFCSACVHYVYCGARESGEGVAISCLINTSLIQTRGTALTPFPYSLLNSIAPVLNWQAKEKLKKGNEKVAFVLTILIYFNSY